jgi:hypothetical protein
MSKNELEKIWDCGVDLPYREKVERLQSIITENFKDKVDLPEEGRRVVYPSSTKYNHYFSDGLYIREMFCEKGYLCFSVIHNTANPLFVMKGSVLISSEDGVKELTAPTFVLTKPGTKRVLYFTEDSVLVNVHPNPDGLTDLEEIEKKMYCSEWEQYDDDLKQDVWQMLEHKDYCKKKENEENK